MPRFLLFALLLALTGLAAADLVVEWTGLAPDPAPLARAGIAPGRLPGLLGLGLWALDALALVALTLLLSGRGGGWLVEGLAAGLLAWVFRGPLVVLSIAALARLPRGPWEQQARIGLVVYPLLGLALAALGVRLLRPPR